MSTLRRILVSRLPLLIGVAVLACSPSDAGFPAGPESPSRFAKGGNGNGNGGGRGTADPSIRSVDPDSALQGETLDVVINGDNFEPGSTVDWALDGVSSDAIQTNGVTFISNKKLGANISVAADAPTEFFDVRVTTPRGRRGIGSEALEVQAKLVGFSDPVSLIGDAEANYFAPLQGVKFTENRNTFQVLSSPYTLTIDIASELAARRAQGQCTEAVFSDNTGLDLDAGPRSLNGDLEINVDKRFLRRGDLTGTTYTNTLGIVVNFTTTIGGKEYFLTSGSSPGAITAMNVSEDRFARVGGFLRVNVDGQVGPICQDIVEYQFRKFSLP